MPLPNNIVVAICVVVASPVCFVCFVIGGCFGRYALWQEIKARRSERSKSAG